LGKRRAQYEIEKFDRVGSSLLIGIPYVRSSGKEKSQDAGRAMGRGFAVRS
jgi:hypothetical protein